jgi:hypothetical protein
MNGRPKYRDGVFVHEAGHVVVGNALGALEDVVLYTGDVDEPFRAYFTASDLAVKIKRSLAGLLAHVEILPDSFDEPLLHAYQESIIFTPSHSFWTSLLQQRRASMSGAETDLKFAIRDTKTLLNVAEGSERIFEYLKQAESEVKRIIHDNRELVQRMANEIKFWYELDDAQKDAAFVSIAALSRCNARASDKVVAQPSAPAGLGGVPPPSEGTRTGTMPEPAVADGCAALRLIFNNLRRLCHWPWM